jgi:predicted DNA-binding transcriptional regulator AlpA
MGERIGRRFLRTPEASEYLGLSSRTLEKHRTYGTGPIYRKLGGRVVYDLADLSHWADSGLRASTADPRTHPRPASPQFAPRHS